MTLAKNLRSNLYGFRPLYAALGVTDLAVERLRQLGGQAAGQEGASADTGEVDRLFLGARQVPGLVIGQAATAIARTQEQYEGLAQRGARLARRAPQLDEQGAEVVSGATPNRSREGGQGVARGRRMAGTAASHTRSAAPTTRRTIRAEAEQVVEAVTHAGRAPSATESPRPVPRRRRTTSAGAARVSAASPVRSAEEHTTHQSGDRHSSVPAGSAVEAGSTAKRTRKSTSRPVAKKSAPGEAAATPTDASSAGPAQPSAPTDAAPARRRPPRRASSTAQPASATTTPALTPAPAAPVTPVTPAE